MSSWGSRIGKLAGGARSPATATVKVSGAKATAAAKRKQHLLVFALLVGVGVLSMAGAFIMGKPSNPAERVAAQEDPVVRNMMTPGATLTEKDGWRGQESARITEQASQMRELSNQVKRLQEQLERKATGQGLTPGGQAVAVPPAANAPGSATDPKTIGERVGKELAKSMPPLTPSTPVPPPSSSAKPPGSTAPAQAGNVTGIPGVTQAGVAGKAAVPPTYPPGTPLGQVRLNPNPLGPSAGTGLSEAVVAEKPASRIAKLADEDDEDDDKSGGASRSGTKGTPVALQLPAATGSASRQYAHTAAQTLTMPPTGGQANGVGGGTAGAGPRPPVPVPSGRTAENYLPSGTFMTGKLLAGMDAPTGAQAQNNPMPVLIKLTDNAYMPSRMRGEVKECFVVGTGFGDLSSERANIRTESLSCVKTDGTAIDMPIQGYVADEDGKAGLRGVVVSRQGQALANALQAGIFSGFAEALRFSSSTNVPGALGGVAQIPTPGREFQAGLGTGLGKSLDRLSQYYIQLAEKMFPVIAVDADRNVTVVLKRGTFIDNRMPTTTGSAGTSNMPRF